MFDKNSSLVEYSIFLRRRSFHVFPIHVSTMGPAQLVHPVQFYVIVPIVMEDPSVKLLIIVA